MKSYKSYVFAPALGLLLLSASGCATKKFVRQTVDPVSQRVDATEQADQKQNGEIDSLHSDVSRIDETTSAIDKRVQEAARTAQQGVDAAAASDKKADSALSAAAENKRLADAGISDVNRRMMKLDDYSLVGTESVLFGFGRDSLDDAAKEAIAAAVMHVGNLTRYVVEVQGFTDSTGDASYNLALSQRRANAVVRALTTEHDIPLYRIAVLGVGAETPVADNSTSEGRRQNRRVEVRVYSADAALTSNQQVSSN